MEQTKISKIYYEETVKEIDMLKQIINEEQEVTQNLIITNSKQLETINKLTLKVDDLEKINKQLTCVYENTQKFILNIKAIYVNEQGEWISLKWYNVGKWIRLGKITFIFVKTTLTECFNITFKPRKMTWLGTLINQIK